MGRDRGVWVWLPTMLAAIFVLLHLVAWAIVLLRVPMGVVPVVWLWRVVGQMVWLMWFTWLVV